MPVSCQMCSHYKGLKCQKNLSQPNAISIISVETLVGFCDELTVEESEKKGGGP